ncbi:MAG: leucine-rich repeat domain-containing protein [Firmicutes bacterium]|nr:leucine-rich repeat domain-containing protein [Bacillota bacterium]
MKIKVLVFTLAFLLICGCTAGNKQTDIDDHTKPDMPGNEEETVVIFTCPELERIVREELFMPEGDILSTDMQMLYEIRIKEDNVKDLNGLEYATNLYSLSINKNDIESLEPISNINSLTYITISYSEIEQQPVHLGELPSLIRLSIIDSNISEIDFLENFTALEELTLSSNYIENIDALSDLHNLRQVNLARNNISSIEALENKKSLEVLDLQSNNVSDISVLASAERLYNLTLSYNPVYNLKPLENLANLQELRIYLDHDVKHLIFDHVAILEGKGIEIAYHR